MRYFHENIDAILEFLQKNQLYIYMCRLNGRFVKRAAVDDVHKYFQQTFRYMGDAPSEFIYATDESGKSLLSMRAMVEMIERDGSPLEFVLVGENDGGLISVSRSPLEFQKGAQEGMWWRPFGP